MMVSAGLNVLFQVQTAAERLDAARAGLDIPLAERLIGIIGIATMISLAWLLSHNRKAINWRLVGTGLGLQILFGVIVLKTSAGRAVFLQAVGAAGLAGRRDVHHVVEEGERVFDRPPRFGRAAAPAAARAQWR